MKLAEEYRQRAGLARHPDIEPELGRVLEECWDVAGKGESMWFGAVFLDLRAVQNMERILKDKGFGVSLHTAGGSYSLRVSW